MVAYSFKARFAEPILAGTKDQTIRAEGKRRHARPDGPVHVYTGMRTRQCRLIARATCLPVWPIDIFIERTRYGTFGSIMLPDETIAGEGLDSFARRDGFTDFSDMADFWLVTHSWPGSSVVSFSGVLIRWKLKTAGAEA